MRVTAIRLEMTVQPEEKNEELVSARVNPDLVETVRQDFPALADRVLK